MINFSGKKIACISDIHLGVHQDSRGWHDIAFQFATWLAKTLNERNITDIIIAGDIFHNRHEIGVSTIHTAHAFFEILKDFNIVVTIGNHDSFYRDKPDVNSVSILGNKNITVLQQLYTYNYRNKKITFCPWGTVSDEIPTSDIIVGHFEIENFRMNHHKVCDHGETTQALIQKGTLIISGHFHYRDHRKYENGHSILYLGSPYELDFGDRDQTKGISILDVDTLDIEFIENTITPKHKKIKLSDILTNKINKEKLETLITNNFISLCIDEQIGTQALDMMLLKFAQYKPLHVRTDFNIFDVSPIPENSLEGLSLDIETALSEFINLLEVDTSKKDILDKCLDLYRISQVTND